MAAQPRPAPGALRAEIGPLLTLSVPMMVGLSAMTLMGVVDTVMVAPLGTVPLAAVGIASAVRPLLQAALLIVMVWMLGVMALLLLAGEAIAGALSDDPAVVALTVTLFPAVAAMQVADGVQSTTLGALRGMLDARWPTMVSLIAYWPVALPAGYAMGFGLGLGAVGVWVGFALGLAVAAVALPLRYWHLTAR